MMIFENSFDQITIPDNESVRMIDQYWHGSWSKTIKVGTGAKLHYLIIMKEEVELNLRVESVWEWAEIFVKGLLLAKDGSKLKLTAHAHLMHNHAEADLHLVSFLQNGSETEVDGGVDLHEGVSKISGHLLEENIVLGEDIKIKTLPMLDVHSSDVSASHGCRITKLDPGKMFYMRSKGLSKEQAEELMIRGYFEQVFEWNQGDEIDTLKEWYLDYLLWA